MIVEAIIIIIITVEMSNQNVKLLNKFGKVNIQLLIILLLFFIEIEKKWKNLNWTKCQFIPNKCK